MAFRPDCRACTSQGNDSAGIAVDQHALAVVQSAGGVAGARCEPPGSPVRRRAGAVDLDRDLPRDHSLDRSPRLGHADLHGHRAGLQ